MSNADETMRTERRDLLYAEVVALRSELKEHMTEEMPVLRALMQELGTSEQIRERRIFIEILIEREKVRMKLRAAIIQKGLLLALVALAIFIGQAVWHELIASIKIMFGKP